LKSVLICRLPPHQGPRVHLRSDQDAQGDHGQARQLSGHGRRQRRLLPRQQRQDLLRVHRREHGRKGEIKDE
jgi:hypothetical protein